MKDLAVLTSQKCVSSIPVTTHTKGAGELCGCSQKLTVTIVLQLLNLHKNINLYVQST